jgi:hypothetical protein
MRRRGTLALAMLTTACSDRPSLDDEAASASESSATSEGEGTSESTDEGENLPPTAPSLLSPSDEALDVPIVAELCWSAASDPEGDAIGYRVWIDDIELANGKTGEYGFVDTCTGPLDFVGDTTFAWHVRAFDLAQPELESADSETWTFTTVWGGEGKPLLIDDFSEDLGWTFGGDATSGQWIRGKPRQVLDAEDAIAQPGACSLGDTCLYTGANPDGVLGLADVDGGTVIATSPAFDPSEFATLAVSLDRFFYRSTLIPTGVQFEVALLVPDAEAPDGVAVHVLEQLDGGPTAEAANVWSKVAFAACGIPMVAGTRLRVSARDPVVPEAVIVEAAIDQLQVVGHVGDELCTPGPGAVCDPNTPEAACGPDLSCCADGPVFSGVYRCRYPASAIGDQPPPAPGDPFTGPLGCDAPDLEVRADDLWISVDNLFVPPDSCTIYEGCVNGSGWRRVLRFDGKTANVGSSDLLLGVPANHPDLFTFSPCHEHHHFDDYARYTLLDGDQVVAAGHKQAFCLVDIQNWAWPELGSSEPIYNCFNQGISVGWLDIYDRFLDCQWIDVTGLPYGDYTLRIEVNLPPPGKAHPTLVERDYANNVAEIPVTVDGN